LEKEQEGRKEERKKKRRKKGKKEGRKTFQSLYYFSSELKEMKEKLIF
jgi:hypothetical protein